MEVKELIVNKPSDLFNILNRKEYTKLTLNCEVNPKLLNGFDNIKELTISSEKMVNKHINEYYINSYSFKDNLEKITFVNINSFGYFYKRTRKNKYNCTDKISLKCSNLKKVCFILPENNYKLNFYGYYLKELENLEELEIDTLLGFRVADTIYCKNSLKRVNVKLSKLNKEYTFELLYPIYCISSLCFSESHKNLNLDYYGKNVNTYVKTDVLTDKQSIKTIFNEITDKSIINNSLYIPDYVTKISFDNINYYEKIEDISFNINLLNSIEDKSKITDNTYLELLKTITIRNTNEMSLFSEKVINVNDVGTLEKLYIEDHKLYMVYDKEIIIVDSEGIITKETIGKKEEPKLDVKSEKKIEFDLDKYSINELEEYLLYRKLLENIKDNNDKELTDAVNIVGNKLVKNLIKVNLMSKEVVIDKKTNIKNIQNKEECEVLTLKCRVNPKRLKEFTNVKELTIDYLEKLGCNYNERNIGLLPFNDKIEKLIFKTFYTIGEDKTRGILKYYKFILPNLKSIEFPSYIYNYYEDYLEKITSLEEIIFNFNDDARTYLDGLMYTFSNDIKRIIIKYKDKEYTIEPKYKIGSIDDISYDEDDHEITLEFSDNYTESEIHININNDYIREDNNWEIHSNNDTVYIPDYATNLNSYENSGIKKLSFNLNLLNHIDERDTIIYHCDSLKKIELRSNNEMSLMDKKEINICDYGKLLDIYIENYKLVLEYQDFKILIDNKGKITKLDNTKEFEEILDNYSLEELEVYASYLRLLKISNELSYQTAMSEISKTLTKKYPKFLK